MKRLFACVAVAALGACQQSAQAPANQAAIANKAPASDNGAAASATADMSAMMASMRAVPMAHDAAMKAMHERHEGMEQIGKATKAAGRTLKSGAPDLATVRASAATIAKLAGQSSTWFPHGTGPDVGKTGAKPQIWQKPEDFAAKTRDFQRAASAFDAAAKAGEMSAIEARFGELGKTCKACHDDYRSDMHKK